MAIYVYSSFILILESYENKILFSITPTQMNKVGREKCIHIHLLKRVAPSSGKYTKIRKKGDSVIPSVSLENVGWANPGKHMVMFLSNKSSEAALADDKIDVIMTSLQWNCLGAIQRCSLTHAGVTSHRFWNWAGFF